jgi:hypothetical protein
VVSGYSLLPEFRRVTPVWRVQSIPQVLWARRFMAGRDVAEVDSDASLLGVRNAPINSQSTDREG